MGLVKRLGNFRAASYEVRAAGESKTSSYCLRATSNQKIIPDWFTRSSQFVARSDAAEIVEAAMVLPLVFMFLLGCVWFGRAFNIYTTITQAAQQGAITAARATCATCGSDFPNISTVANSVVSVMQASSLDPNQIKQYQPATIQSCTVSTLPCATSPQKVTVCSNVLLNASSATQAPQCGTLVSFQYPFQFNLPFTSLNNQQIVLTAQAESRMEQ
jgi:hypothetical protein